MTVLYCAICGDPFEPDVDHVRVEAESVRMKDANDTESFAFHTVCWISITDGWRDPV
jgi:hypothetical protein